MIPPIQEKVDAIHEGRTKEDIKRMKKEAEVKRRESAAIQAKIDAANAKIAALKAKWAKWLDKAFHISIIINI